MIKRNNILTALIFSGLFLFSCQQKETVKNNEQTGIKIAKPITYEVLVKNPNPDDDWKTECLANTDTKILVEDILKAVKNGNLPAFDYYDNHELSKSEIKEIIKEGNLSENTANIQFEEEWYWDKNELALSKKVNKIMLGYAVYDGKGAVRGYKASFVIDLNLNKN
ncbi:hypothetical protein L3049_18990 [Labilibaculum sp. DW002]|uniref:Lipoprotein n=1 Tax=Paralabilibaculum antarcticum TaxID=2912572 RepID=A0ABT5VXE1_9BACT|nr:hypothetical protein [Labilibaculum sp. DW002]MDE5420082.1 hypothetical protein [Labilibaculum sp. DW002]